MKQFHITSLTETKKLAAHFAKLLKIGDIIALEGNLGVGKTAFTRFLIQSLTKNNEEVPSPTFTLLQTYDTPDFPIYHFDLYRLERPQDVYELGIEDAFAEGVSLIEWPNKMEHLLPLKKVLTIKIDLQNEERDFTFSSQNPSWIERLKSWKE